MSELYYEDITVDDELPPLERTPTEDQAIEFFGRDNPTKLSWISHYVGAWAGSESNLISVRVAFRRPDIAGNPLTLSGRVVDKRQEDGINIVELEVVTLADGQPSVRGNVQVEIPGRTS